MKSGILEWDSNFFRKKIFFIEDSSLPDETINEEIESLHRSGADCIYVFSKKPIDILSGDVVLADKKRIYRLDVPFNQESRSSHGVKILLFRGESKDLYDLAFQSGEHSRFRTDPHFSKFDFENLYRKWIDKSVEKNFADYIYVAYNPTLCGFITAKLKEDFISIGLFATDKSFRGQGIGTMLMQRIVNLACQKKLKVEVVTQADNKVACQFYESFGFEQYDEQFVYHVWLNQDKKK